MMRPSFACNFRPSVKQRARGMPGAQCTRSLACAGELSQHASIHSGGTGKHPAFPTQWFYGLYVISPATNSFCHRRRADWRVHLHPVGPSEPPRRLSINNGCQDHTTSPSATLPLVLRAALDRSRVASPCDLMRARHRRVHRIPPRVRDDRDTPSQWDETAWSIAAIGLSENQNIFSYGAGQPKSHQI